MRFIYYLHSGMPIFSHEIGDLPIFRYITFNLILQGLCRNQDIVDTFNLYTDSVRRGKLILSKKFESASFTVESRQGWS
jgi:pentatricopeptide repeat protein